MRTAGTGTACLLQESIAPHPGAAAIIGGIFLSPMANVGMKIPSAPRESTVLFHGATETYGGSLPIQTDSIGTETIRESQGSFVLLHGAAAI